MYHFTGNTSISAHHDSRAHNARCFFDESGISCRELHDVERGEVLTALTANRTSNPGYRFDQCHDELFNVNTGSRNDILHDRSTWADIATDRTTIPCRTGQSFLLPPCAR